MLDNSCSAELSQDQTWQRQTTSATSNQCFLLYGWMLCLVAPTQCQRYNAVSMSYTSRVTSHECGGDGLHIQVGRVRREHGTMKSQITYERKGCSQDFLGQCSITAYSKQRGTKLYKEHS